jgi:hypothetical protein
MSSAPIGENSVASAIVITPPFPTLTTGAFAPNVTRLGRWRYFRELPFPDVDCIEVRRRAVGSR